MATGYKKGCVKMDNKWKETNTGVKVKLWYTPEDLTGFDYDASLGTPGSPPYTRGIYPSMYRERLWTMRQYSGFSTSENTNSRFKFLIDQGQTGSGHRYLKGYGGDV